MGGGTKTTQTAKLSPEEKAFIVKQTELAEFQLGELQTQRDLQAAERERLEPFAAQIEELAPLQLELARQQIERSLEFAPIEKELLQAEIDRIRQGGRATPEQLALIKEQADRAIAAGETDIERFRTESLRGIKEQLAPSLGLRPTDSPILDRGGLIAAEAQRQQGQLVQGVRGAEAAAGLSFPLAQGALQSGQAQFQQQLLSSTQQFQAQLRDAAFANRLRLSSQPQQLGLGLATGIPFPNPQFSRSITQRTSGGGGIGTVISGIGAVGGLLSGIGSIFTPSSRALKRDPERAESGMRDITHEATLEKIEKLPVERWRYKEGIGLGDADHIGPYAEDFEEVFDVGDGVTINLLDAVGIGLSATKGLANKVRLLEHATYS